jgi:hypothetical protein
MSLDVVKYLPGNKISLMRAPGLSYTQLLLGVAALSTICVFFLSEPFILLPPAPSLYLFFICLIILVF